MKCPSCKNPKTRVTDCRTRNGHFHRRRECECGCRFSTYEITDDDYFNYKDNMNDFKEELSEFIKSYRR